MCHYNFKPVVGCWLISLRPGKPGQKNRQIYCVLQCFGNKYHQQQGVACIARNFSVNVLTRKFMVIDLCAPAETLHWRWKVVSTNEPKHWLTHLRCGRHKEFHKWAIHMDPYVAHAMKLHLDVRRFHYVLDCTHLRGPQIDEWVNGHKNFTHCSIPVDGSLYFKHTVHSYTSWSSWLVDQASEQRFRQKCKNWSLWCSVSLSITQTSQLSVREWFIPGTLRNLTKKSGLLELQKLVKRYFNPFHLFSLGFCKTIIGIYHEWCQNELLNWLAFYRSSFMLQFVLVEVTTGDDSLGKWQLKNSLTRLPAVRKSQGFTSPGLHLSTNNMA